MVAILAAALFAALFAASALLNGFVLKVVWGWFITPTFNIHPLSLIQAIGLCLVVALVTHQHIPREKMEQKVEMLGYEFLSPVTVLVVGWIVHLFMR